MSSCSKDHNCDPCLTIGQHIKAHGFCVNCQEYLCKNCFECHQRTEASRDHQLTDNSDIDNQSILGRASNECTEKCHVHQKEVIKYFCKNHEVLGCTDCMTCDLDYMPDKCAGIWKSDVCRQVMRELDRKVKEAEDIIQQANIESSHCDSSHENAAKEIIKFRKEIDDQLDEKQKKMQLLADERKSTDKQKIQRDYTAAKQDAQLYITIKRANSKLSSNEIKDVKEALEDTIVSYVFERSKDIQNMLSGLDDFGTLNSQSAGLPAKNAPFDGLTFSRNIKTKPSSYISGCAVLARKKVLQADYCNCTFIVVDTESKVITEEKSSDNKPWDIAVLPQDQVAVTMPDRQEILILSAAGKRSTIRKIQVTGICYGITYGNCHLYVVCRNPSSVLSMDVQGNDQRNILPNSERYKTLRYCMLSDDSSTIYISEYTSHSVLRLTVKGEILSIFKHDDLQYPEGMVILDDGSLLVCSYGNGTILHISGDLKQCQKVASVEKPQSICYNHHQHEIYVCTWSCGLLAVLSLK
ncbi:E3 ubiquitin-protein ligase TRIM71-like [Mercenaria mercenaria]|uniref:E3 ubiquitin-protein ligase TRIM71-like n=1 Tax=Mercenaria mercenaria TaxID=6596 RepID=UPI00234F8900|nr:E3 ubiquitin-protein ligase TRIM71-like [Mercenaria mercenaria]